MAANCRGVNTATEDREKKVVFCFFFPLGAWLYPEGWIRGCCIFRFRGVSRGSSLHCTPPGDTTSVLMICLVILTTEVLTLRIFHGKLASSPSKQTFSIKTRREVVLGPGQCCCLCQPCPSSFPMTTRREEERRWFRGGKGAPTSREEPREHPPKAPQHRATGAG